MLNQKFRSGYDWGAVSTTVIEALPGHDERGEPRCRSVAVTNWGCGCCKPDDDAQSVAMSRRIAASLNLIETLATADGRSSFANVRERAREILATYEREVANLKVPSWLDEDEDEG